MIKPLMKKMITFAQQNKPPNYTNGDGKFYLVRCFNHPYPYNKKGIENYLPAVASGECAWCGWTEKKNLITIEQYNAKMEKILKRLKNSPTHEILTAMLDFASSVELPKPAKKKKKL